MIQSDDKRMIRSSKNFLSYIISDESRDTTRQRTCSANARLILFRLIISFLLRTFIANNFSVFFSRTRYTLPTSPLPSNLILWKLLGPISTLLTRIELEE